MNKPILTVAALREMLAKVPDDAVIVINGDVAVQAATHSGRIREGYYNMEFSLTPKGKEVALIFERYGEMSTGEVALLRI